jgi:hypothetical protein
MQVGDDDGKLGWGAFERCDGGAAVVRNRHTEIARAAELGQQFTGCLVVFDDHQV